MHEPVFLLRLFPLFSVYNLYPPPLYFTLHLKACSAASFFQQNINICIAYSTRLKVNQPTYCLAFLKNFFFLVQQDKKGVSYIRIKWNKKLEPIISLKLLVELQSVLRRFSF